MSRLPPGIVGDVYTNSNAWDILISLVEIGDRMAGHAGEKRGAELISDAFKTCGLRDVTIEEFEINGWWRRKASLSVRGTNYNRENEIIALPGSTNTHKEAELIDLGYGLPDEIGPRVEGKIVLARTDVPDSHDRWVHRLEKYAAAVRAGAAGFLYQNHIQGGLPPTGEIGWGRRPSPIPAVGVSYELGSRLARYASKRNTTVQLSVDCRSEMATSVNVGGSLGPDTDQEVLITAHVDSHDISEGACDNAVGCALVSEIARILASIEEQLETRISFVIFGSEEIGLFGAQHFTNNHEQDSIKCVLNIDGAGGSRTPLLRTYDFEQMNEIFEEINNSLNTPCSTTGGLDPHTDAWPFAVRGIPAVTAGSESGDSGRGWGHTHADTLDKLDARDIRDLAIIYAEYALAISSDDYELNHTSQDEIQEKLTEHTESELSFFGRLPF